MVRPKKESEQELTLGRVQPVTQDSGNASDLILDVLGRVSPPNSLMPRTQGFFPRNSDTMKSTRKTRKSTLAIVAAVPAMA